MTLSANTRKWHEVYESLEGDQKDAVDEVFQDVSEILRLNGLKTAMDDRAETLVAAITQYVVESQQ